MGLKNWTLVARSIKGLVRGMTAYRRYLVDTEHRNHKNKTESIDHVWGDGDAVVDNQKRLWRRMQEVKTRGRPRESLAQSFVLSLPKDLGQPTHQQWQVLGEVMMITIAKELGEPLESIKRDSFINVHQNTQNPHLNLMIGALREEDGKVIGRRLAQKKLLMELKRMTTRGVNQLLDVDHTIWVPEQSNLRTMKKWQWEQAKVLDTNREEINRRIEAEKLQIEGASFIGAFHEVTKAMGKEGRQLRRRVQQEFRSERFVKEREMTLRNRSSTKGRFTASKGKTDPYQGGSSKKLSDQDIGPL